MAPGAPPDEGQIHINAGLAVSFLDPGGDGAMITLTELDPDVTAVGDLVNVVVTNNSLTTDLPVQVVPTGLDAATVAHFAGAEIVVTASDLFGGVAAQISATKDLLDFSNTTPLEMLGMIEQFGGWLAGLANSELLDLDIPLVVDTTVGKALELAKTFKSRLLEPLIERDIDGLPILDPDGNPILKFDSIQELAQELFAQLSLPSVDLAHYDPATRDLTFAVAWSDVLPATSEAVDFDLDLGDFGNIHSAGNLDLTANVGFDLTFGLNLAPGEAIVVSPPIFRPTVPTDGVLSATATFDLSLYDQLDTGDAKVAEFTVTLAPDGGNTGITGVGNLVADLQAAIDAHLLVAGLQAGEITVEFAGTRLALTAPPTVVTDPADGLPKFVDRHLEMTTDYDDPAYQELGLLTAPTRYDGTLTADAHFTLALDGVGYAVEVTVADTAANSSVDDLVDDINRKINLAVEGSESIPAAVQAFRVNDRGNRIAFLGTGVGKLALTGGQDPADGAAVDLGIDPSFQNAQRAHATGLFLDNASLTGDFTLAATGINASANLGFLGVDVVDSSGSVTGAAGIVLKDPATGGSRVTLGALSRELGQGNILYDGGTGTGIVAASVTGLVDVDLTIRPQVGSFSAGDATLSLDLSIVDWLVGPPVLDDVTDPNAIKVTATWAADSVYE